MKMGKRRNRIDRVITWFVFISLIASVIYAIVGIVLAEPGAVPALPHSRLKSDYVLMLVQCLLGIGIVFLPSVLEKHWKLTITNRMYILFVLFLYCGIVLGEVRSFYYKIPHWDSFLHLFSGAMLGVVGFSVIDILNDSKSVRVHMTDKFVAVFSFCFALSLGTLWEIYEFTVDSVATLNMQKYALEDGTPLVGVDSKTVLRFFAPPASNSVAVATPSGMSAISFNSNSVCWLGWLRGRWLLSANDSNVPSYRRFRR
ncbi:membrane protein [Clostridia bacterium]|nr:membrane protein [Clostridia bacterium]